MRRGAIAAALIVLSCSLSTASFAQAPESGAALGAPSGEEEPRSEPASESAPERESPRLLVITSGLAGAADLPGMLRTQLPGWDVELRDEPAGMLAMDRMKAELGPEDALLWLEAGDSVVHVVVTGREHRALSSPIPTGAPVEGLSRVYALAAVGLLIDLADQRRRMAAYEASVLSIRNRQLAELRERREEDAQRIDRLARSEQSLREAVARLQTRRPRGRSVWRSPLPPTGWSFRVGWATAFSPYHEFNYGWPSAFDTSPRPYAYPTAGLRLSLARRLGERVQVGSSLVTLHARGLWNGSVSAFASVHSRTRFRVGVSGEVGLLVAKENRSDISLTWSSVRFYVPLDLGVVVNEHGGVFVKFGPLITKAPGGWFVGYDLVIEWEFG